MNNPVAQSKRIYFRPLELEDIKNGWHKWINDSEANEFLDGIYPQTKDNLLNYYKEQQPPKAVMFAICDKKNNKYFGNANLGNIDWVNKRCTYGRLIGLKSYRSKGYGSEALILLVKYGFLKLGMNRIYTGVIEDNTPSLISNEKVGFVREGIQREAIFRNGKFVNVVSLAMTRRDFDKKYK